MPRRVSMNLKGPPQGVVNNLGNRGRAFIRELRKTVLPLPDLLKKLGISERDLGLWMRGKGFQFALGRAMYESDRVRDLEIAVGSRAAARQISTLLRHRNPEIVRRACETIFALELHAQEIKTARKRRAGMTRNFKLQYKRVAALNGAVNSMPNTAPNGADAQTRRTTGPFVGHGSPVHPDVTDEEAERLLCEMESLRAEVSEEKDPPHSER